MGLLALFGWSLAHASGLQEGAVMTPSELVPQATPAESTEGLDGVLALAEEMRDEQLPEEFIATILTGWWTTCLEILPAKERALGRF